MRDVQIPPAHEPARPWLRSHTNPPHRILVVDKDSDLRLLYADALARPEYSVSSAEDGAVAWETLKRNRYDLLITEHDLLTLTGLELIRRVRAAHLVLPIVMAAERMPVYELVRDPSLQLAATLVKPFTVDALRETVGQVLRAPDRPGRIDESPNGGRKPLARGLQL